MFLIKARETLNYIKCGSLGQLWGLTLWISVVMLETMWLSIVDFYIVSIYEVVFQYCSVDV